MVEIYGFIAVSLIAWAWLVLLYLALTSSRADHERRLKNLQRRELNRKRKEKDEKSWEKHISPTRTTQDMKVKA